MSNVIQFACNHCQSILTVPMHMAGIAGPCPKCGQHIVSPQASTPAPMAPPMAMPQPAPSPAAAWNMPPAQQAQPEPAWGPRPAPAAPSYLPEMPSVPSMESYQPAPQHVPNLPTQGWNAPQAAPQPSYAPEASQMPPPQTWAARPQTAPLMPAPVAAAATQSPSTHMQPTLLRPNSFPAAPESHGQAAPPPRMPPNPLADALNNLPPSTPGVSPATGSLPAPLSRPVTIGGSRLSLLARQLTNTPESGQQLPQAGTINPNELPGINLGIPTPLPDQTRQQQVGNMMFQNALPRGQYIGTQPRSSNKLLKLGVAALLIIGAVGAVGWKMRDEVKNALGYQSQKQPQPPETVVVKPDPIPGVDPAPHAAPQPAENDSRPRTVSNTTPAPDLLPQPRSSEPKPTPAFTPENDSDRPPPRATPVDPASIAKSPPSQTVPPRAVAVEDGVPGKDDAPPPPKPQPAPQGVQTTRTQSGMLASSSSNSAGLVEVGRGRDTPQTVPDSKSQAIGNGARPVVKNVPPKCQPALNGLKSFLAASNWKDRLRYMQLPDQMQSKAQLYYSTNADGPVDVDEIHYLRHDEDPQVGRGMHVVFVLFSRVWDYGFPVMVEQTGDEARVDWLTFVEFKDDLLRKFLGNYMEGPVRFHVGIRRTHYFEDDVPNHDDLDAFEITTPMENVHGFAFTPKTSPLARSLNNTLSWDKEVSWVVVELQWRKEGKARWVELTSLPQLNFYSEGAPAGGPASAPPADNGKTIQTKKAGQK